MLVDALQWARGAQVPVALLGGGSNVVVPDEGVDGLVLQVALTSCTYEASAQRDGRVCVTAGAGLDWARFVDECVSRELAGLECLGGIPGTVGATPVQNVGAYGQEVSQTITAVTVLDRRTQVISSVETGACAFSYRDSAFKRAGHALRDAVVLSVTFSLVEKGPAAVRYAELARALALQGHAEGAPSRSLRAVHDMVLALRRAKSMVLDPRDENTRSAGSFFTNPVLSRGEADAVCARAVTLGVCEREADVPRFEGPRVGTVKLAAAWLIERAGFSRGLRRGPVGISSRHALALVHHGQGTTRELLAFADEITEGVRGRFGVTLEREPVLLRAEPL